ncbi:PREDICTED: retinol dehydrogenase 12-like isoform X1 [Nicrophorus vespilloides]|uniref:Retinol dehydrogenase 12-like isoform X1 n=2 Tax=Nicrophorus vespilloides TaxID=110193 RepID=A0ABM1MUV9_NICVS|nr:PREDICTED: retinol dehydrogenase 12-like isoform X1 [Nicrophorus vespilloides]
MSCLISIAFYVLLAGIVLKIYAKLSMGWCKAKVCLVGKTALVTGGNSGIGYETALHLASRGCRVIIADVVDSESSRKQIVEETGNDNIIYKWIDLGSLQSTRKFAEDIIKTEPRLDILINNAGVAGFSEICSDDGILMDMHINHFGSFLLTHLLVDILKKTPKSRIVFVSSIGAFLHQVNTVEDINRPARFSHKTFKSLLQYNNSKLCNIISARGFAKRLSKHSITVNAAYPGIVCTPIFTSFRNRIGESTWVFKMIKIFTWSFGKSAEEGAQTTLHCAIDKSVEGISGNFFLDCKVFKLPPKVADDDFSEAVWTESEKIVKLSQEEKIQ